MKHKREYIRWMEELSSDDVGIVGGKNASLGEMISALKERNIRVPGGFATTAEAYRVFIDENDLKKSIKSELKSFLEEDQSLEKTGKAIRKLFVKSDFPQAIDKEIAEAYRELCDREGKSEVDVAVRSSATAEDLPEASFAGQQETFLNISGEEELLEACRKCFASLFTDRAISYREEKGFDHLEVALSVGVQKMVRSDKAGSGVMFSLDTETGFDKVIVINAAWGLGENVVQGTVNPDEYVVFKPLLDDEELEPIIKKQIGSKEKKMIYARGGSKTTKNVETPKKEQGRAVLSDDEIIQLARWGQAIEGHYDKPMDMEWAKDGRSENLYIVQARPETVQSQKAADTIKTYRLKESGEELVSGLSIGQAIATGKAQVIESADDIDEFEDGSILVSGMTDPDWVPIMKRAAGIITDHGGRTSHTAIVSRELAIPAIVGTEDATETIEEGQEITMSCAEGDRGIVYKDLLGFESEELDFDDIPETETGILMNMASPAAAFRWWRLPCHGIGLARMEFIINNIIKIHPLALVRYDALEDKKAKRRIREMTTGYDDKSDFFVDRLARGIARIAAVQYPNKVIVRMSDFKTNEYANLIGGNEFERREDNPMLGFRGASRYYSDRYRDAFALECRAIRMVREKIGLNNVVVMIPFCRTVDEADRVLEMLAENNLERGLHGLKIFMMCEIPSNIILAKKFAARFDGFSIGSNDLTQLVLGIDRDLDILSGLFDERNPAVKTMIRQLIEIAHEENTEIGICGQAPSDYPEFAEFLVEAGIDTISLNPDTVIETKGRVAESERKIRDELEHNTPAG